ncbi:MAG: hypothetical protein NVS1B7_8010 [Candidatus Saccharimonadales bacterium]
MKRKINMHNKHRVDHTTEVKPTPLLPSQGGRYSEIVSAKNRQTQKQYSPDDNDSKKTALESFKKKWSRKRKIITATLGSLAILIVLIVWFGASLLTSLDKVFHGNLLSDLNALLSHARLKGEDQGRVNILIAGNSADDPNHGGAELTDSIMLVSLDTIHHTGFMLSIPRDLWVDIPGWSHQKINAANDVTNFNQEGYPRGGMGQLEQIVQTQLGIPIHYYSLINYAAFKDAVNTVGGITINIKSVDPRGLYDPNINKLDHGPLKLPNGQVTLDGQTALNLARARGDPCGCGKYAYGFPAGDFDRTEHQRQMFTALATKAQKIGVIANPIKVSQLFGNFGKNTATDMKLPEALRLAELTKSMDISALKQLSLNTSGQHPLLVDYRAPDGELALIPAAGIDNFGQIRQYYQQLTSDSPVVKEAPTVVVLNGSNVSGQAHKQAMLLQSKGFNVVGSTDANGQYPTTEIVDLTNGQKPASKQLLLTLLGANTLTTTNTNSSPEALESVQYQADFVIILGKNLPTNRLNN